MKTLFLTSLLGTLATALTPIPGRSLPFKLRADPDLKFMAQYGFLGINGQSLQWGLNATKEYEAFYDETTKTVNATDGSGIFYLRPTHGTPMYYVFSGDPSKDPTPALTISTWTFRNENNKVWLGRPDFMGCPNSPKGPSAIYLYYGPSVTSRCSENFGLEVVFKTTPQPPPPPPPVTSTKTVTETATETATETETETCTTEEPVEPTETCTSEEPEPTETCTEPEPEPTETETCTTEEPEPEPTGTGTPLPPPGTNTTVTLPPVPTETGEPEEPPVAGAASGLKANGGMYLALAVAGGMAVWIL